MKGYARNGYTNASLTDTYPISWRQQQSTTEIKKGNKNIKEKIKERKRLGEKRVISKAREKPNTKMEDLEMYKTRKGI